VQQEMGLGGGLGSTDKDLESQDKEFGLWVLGRMWGWAPRAPGILGLLLLGWGPSVVGGWTTKAQDMILIDTWAQF